MNAHDWRALSQAELDAGGPMWVARRRHPAGTGIPESPEVREHRQDAEAMALASRLDQHFAEDESVLAVTLWALVAGVVGIAGVWGLLTAAEALIWGGAL